MGTALVTGGTGFVGRELVRQLVARGDQVAVLSRSRPAAKVYWFECDFADSVALEKTISNNKFDVIYHCGSLPGDTGNPHEMVRVNVVGLTNMLEVARRMKVKRFVLSSSISAYEWYPATKFRPPVRMPVSEDHPCRPPDIYSSSKRMQELLIETYFHQYEVPTCALRLTAVVGPGGRGGGKMWREFAEQMQAGKQIQLPMFSAEELAHFVDLRDVAEMHICCGEHVNAIGQIFNCCGPQPTRGSEFASYVEGICPGSEATFGFPWSMAQGGEISFDMAKIKSLLHYEPTHSLEDSVTSIYDWVQAGGLEGSTSE